MPEIALSEYEINTDTSDKIPTIPNEKYVVSTDIVGFEGNPYSAYFGVAVFDKDNKEISRMIRWLNDFSGIKSKVTIVFTAPLVSEYVRLIYRINNETPIKCSCKYELTPLTTVTVAKVDPHLADDFDTPENYQLPLARELTTEQELILEKNLVWIFASPRSGTSWLAQQLLSSYTKLMDEPYIGAHIATPGPAMYILRNEITRTIDFFQDAPSYFFSNRYENTWKFHLRKLILNRIYSQFLDLSNKIVIKEPNGSLSADIISKCLPDSKIIIIFRDGRDVMDSKLDAFKKNSWANIRYKLELREDLRAQFIKVHSKIWVKTIEVFMKTLRQHAIHLSLSLKYEDLRKDTLNTLRKIYQFLEIDINEEDLRKLVETYSFENIPTEKRGTGKVVRSASPGKWKESFNENEKSVMNEVMGDTLRKIGYDI